MISCVLALPFLGSILGTLQKTRVSSFSYFTFTLLSFLLSVYISFFVLNDTNHFISQKFFGVVEFKIDYLSSFMLSLSSLLFLLCSSFIGKMDDKKSFSSLLLLMQFFINGVFVSSDLLTFFIFFESILIPMFFIIGCWGGKHRVFASFKFFLYTFSGSISFILASLYLFTIYGTFNIHDLSNHILSSNLQHEHIVWIAFFITFLVKIPSFPFHTWLPNAHVQAPVCGSVILAGILIKIGIYGIIRILIQMMPESSFHFSNFAIILSFISVIYASIVAYSQKNIKMMIAYSSIAHMGFSMAGIFSMNKIGMHGAIFQMISHGFVSSALFMCIGILYSRTNTLEINRYGGIAKTLPFFSFLFIVFVMSSIGLPGTSGFIGEFLSMVGLFQQNINSAIIISFGIFVGALYMLTLSKKVIWGSNSFITLEKVSVVEYAPILILAVISIAFGLFPSYLIGDHINYFIDDLFNNNIFSLYK